MNRLGLTFAVVFTVFGVVQSCKYDDPDPKPGQPVNNTPTVSDRCNWDTVYFVKEILPIIISSCTGSQCHDDVEPQNNVRLTNYTDIIKTGEIQPGDPEQSLLYKMITNNDPENRMPPQGSPQLTPEQVNAVRIWISQGALNNDCNNGCDSLNFTFTDGIWPILQTTCMSCHSGFNPPGGVSITNYSEVRFIVDNGLFEKAVFHLPGATPMPPGGQLDSCSLYKVRKWLDAGAPQN